MNTSPFKFLDAYQKEDQDIFFGREVEVDMLYEMTFQTNLILVYGMSGTGKTSIIQCGLASRFDTSDWFEVFVRRQENINKALVRELKHKDKDNSFEEGYSIEEMIRSLYLDYLRPIYLIFDQFEEVFILGTESEQKVFIESIKPLLEKPELPCKIIIVIREEYLAHLSHFEKEVPYLFEKRLRIEPMTRINAQRVVTNTIKNPRFNIELEPASLAADIVDNVTEVNGRVQLTYLQVLLDKLYQLAVKKNPDRIVFDPPLLEQTGEIKDILSGFLDEQLMVFAREVDSKDAALRFLKAFVSEKGTKIPVSLDELDESLPNMNRVRVNIYLDFFTDRRLLKPIENNQFELAHDSLAEKVFRSKTLGISMPEPVLPEKEPESIFAGFEPYTVEMSPYFHGRGAEVRDLFNKVVNETKIRTTLVFGPMGVGKSSLVLAGLTPRLASLAKVHYFRCSRSFLESATMTYMLNHPAEKRSAAESLILKLAFQWEKEQPRKNERKVLIFDQFEEFYIWITTPAQLYNFYSHIEHLLKTKQNCDLIFVVRDEFFSHLQDFESLVPGILDEQVRVKHMDFNTAQRIVEKMAEHAGLVIEDDGIIENIVNNICEEDGKVNLTYLQMYMEKLFQEAS